MYSDEEGVINNERSLILLLLFQSAGLSSSSALVCCAGLATLHANGLELSKVSVGQSRHFYSGPFQALRFWRERANESNLVDDKERSRE